VKLGTVFSDVFGVSGRNILELLFEQGYLDAGDDDQCLKGTVRPGVSEAARAVIIAGIDVDMVKFPSAEQLSSWAGVAPGNHVSAGEKSIKS
jgi:hypothetical protein